MGKSITRTKSRPSIRAEPAWDVAWQFPEQGTWTEEEYFHYITQRGYELCDGRVEMLPKPTEWHQTILLFLYNALREFTRPRDLGKLSVAGLRVRTRPGKIREPDIVLMKKENFSRRSNQKWEGADLVMEVVSEDDPQRDYTVKRAEYAKAGIAEYWIVDPAKEIITVLKLTGRKTYAVHGRYKRGQGAESALLPDFSVDVTEALKKE